MHKARFTEHEIVSYWRLLKQGVTLMTSVVRAVFNNDINYNWEAQYSGMEYANIKKLQILKRETAG